MLVQELHLAYVNLRQDVWPELKVIWDSNPDVCRITPEILWIH